MVRFAVAPHKDAWIEIVAEIKEKFEHYVAPHKGAWIEIPSGGAVSRPGLVAPHKGAWIEIGQKVRPARFFNSRAPQGRVD